MCNQHVHYSPNPEIVQLMPVQNQLYAVYQTSTPYEFAIEKGRADINIVPILFMALIRHGDKTMVEGFFASGTIQSCEDLEGFKGYATSLVDAEKLYA